MMKSSFEINRIHIENCLDTMRRMPTAFVDLTVTSPPYDKLRDYDGYAFDFPATAAALYRITKPGGVVVWVVNDMVENGSETGTSYRQALGIMGAGFRLHDSMIYLKNGAGYPAKETDARYSQVFEFMFIFSKGKPKTANLICDKRNRWQGARTFGENSERLTDGSIRKRKQFATKFTSPRENVWKMENGFGYSSTDEIAYRHPAIFPEALACDHIRTWSLPGELVYDPFLGSGTTAKMAILLNRNWVGSEISERYALKIASPRIQKAAWLIASGAHVELPDDINEGLFSTVNAQDEIN